MLTGTCRGPRGKLQLMAQVASLLHHLAFPWNEEWQLGRTQSCDTLDDLTAFLQGFESVFGFQQRIIHVYDYD